VPLGQYELGQEVITRALILSSFNLLILLLFSSNIKKTEILIDKDELAPFGRYEAGQEVFTRASMLSSFNLLIL
jgi:hypothetical protein